MIMNHLFARSDEESPRSPRPAGRLHRWALKAYRKRGFAFSLNFAPKTGRLSGLCHLPTSALLAIRTPKISKSGKPTPNSRSPNSALPSIPGTISRRVDPLETPFGRGGYETDVDEDYPVCAPSRASQERHSGSRTAMIGSTGILSPEEAASL